MSFMKPFLAERPQQSNYSTQDIINTEPESDGIVDTVVSVPSPASPSSAPSPLSSISQSSKKRKYSSVKETPTSVALQEYVNYKKSKIHTPKDHLTKYFQSVEESVRTFPPILQIQVKSKISEIIHEAELKNITSPTTSTYTQVDESPPSAYQQTLSSQSTNIHTLPPYKPHVSQQQSSQYNLNYSSGTYGIPTRQHQQSLECLPMHTTPAHSEENLQYSPQNYNSFSLNEPPRSYNSFSPDEPGQK